MKITKNIRLWGVLALFPFMSNAQTHITFDTEDYSALGVYDTWEESPFRTGSLSGNVAVVDNHLMDEETNASAKILGVQRSRYGSNTFGVKIGLKQTFELTPTQRYVHVMINKPVAGRVMLIGLGKRTDRPEQSNEVEQFWSYPVYEVKTGEWFDAVFPIKGNGGIEIHSLVVVPHCEAPHTLDGDFVAYVDDILLDDNMKPRLGASDYGLSFTADTPHGRQSDRWTSNIGMQGSTDGTQTITIPTEPSKLAYNQLLDVPLKAKAGNTVTATLGYGGTWMHSYIYLDKGNDGEFSYAVDANNNLDTSTDLLAYSFYSPTGSSTGKNSAGTTKSNNIGITPPSFTIPSDLANGFYRMRYKIDWNNIDPAGDIESFISNGGIIVDVMLNVHGDYCNITNNNRNGEVTAADGTSLDGYSAPFGQDFKVKMVPSNGFEYNGIRVRHGYNLTGDSLVHGNPQYRDVIIYADEFDAEDCVVIPAEYMDGDVLIEGLFVEAGKSDGRVKVTYNVVSDDVVVKSQTVKVTKGSAFPEPSFEAEVSSAYWSLSGMPDGVCVSDTVVNLTLVNNLPFKPSTDFEHARWHNMSITASRNYLKHTSSSYISVGSSTTATPSEDDETAQWAFIGNVFDGFSIVNRAAGEGYVLSSSTNTSSNTGGSTYPIMTATPVPSTHNTYWIPTKSTDISGANGFYLHQLGYASNRMNSRDSRLAYWTGGADAGSTFVATELSGYGLTIVAPASNQGTLEVFNGGEQLSSGDRVEAGTVLTAVATPAEYHSLVDITVNNDPIEAVDGVYTFVMPEAAVAVAAVFERDADAPLEYCVPVYAGTGSSRTTTTRTDRHLDQLNVTDGTNTITVNTNGSTRGREVYKDETSKILVTSAGNTVYVETIASMWSMHNFIYVDFDLNGFDSNDRVMYSESASGTFSFTIPEDQPAGAYRVRHMIDWDNDNPCEFAQGQGSDNAESVIDFLINVESSSQGIDEIGLDPANGPIEYFNLQGIRVDSENLTPGYYIARQGDKAVKILVK